LKTKNILGLSLEKLHVLEEKCLECFVVDWFLRVFEKEYYNSLDNLLNSLSENRLLQVFLVRSVENINQKV